MYRATELRPREGPRLVKGSPGVFGGDGLDDIVREARKALPEGPALTLQQLRWECDAMVIGSLLDYEIKVAFRSAHRSPSAGGAARSREDADRSLEPSDLLSAWVEKELLPGSGGGLRRELEKALDLDRFRAALVARAKDFLRRPVGPREKRKRLSFRRLSQVLNRPPFAQRIHGKFDMRAPFTRDMTRRLNALVDHGARLATAALAAESGLIPALLVGEATAIGLTVGGVEVPVTRADLSVRTMAWSLPGASLDARPFTDADLRMIGGDFIAARENLRLRSALDDREAAALARMLTERANGCVTPDNLWIVLDVIHSDVLDRDGLSLVLDGNQLTQELLESLSRGEATAGESVASDEERVDWEVDLQEGSIALLAQLTDQEAQLLALLHENDQLRGEALASACGVSKTMIQKRKRAIMKKAAEAVAERPSDPTVGELELIHGIYYAVQELAFRAVESDRVNSGPEAD